MSKNASLKGKKVVVGVTGGIASYKACELVRLLAADGADVHVVMTRGATQFVTPMAFQALSKNLVRTEIFDLTEESRMGHIELADMADLVVIAPASADFIAKAAHGICDDLLTTILCATRAPVILCPAMNVHMFENQIVQENIARLKKLGWQIVGPAEGDLACGYEGVGRLVEPEEIVTQVKKLFASKIKIVRQS